MVLNKVENPILRGFNPDPSVCKAEGVYYIAVSSFEWLPGVRLYSSKDLINWEHETDLISNQVNLKGNPRNASIWAPMLSYCDGLFYLLYTDVKSTKRPFKDTHNYMITAPSIKGPWSEPIYLNSSGFDPSIFHDDDGKKWILNEIWDYRMATPNKSCGVVLQEYDPAAKRLTGKSHKIFDGTHLAKTEAPHIYKRGGYYYLITAEGGTSKNHSVTVCRAKEITGPYEVDPHFPMLTASDKPASPLQCSGHMSIVEGEFGKCYGVYLCTRPLLGKYAVLGRETAIQEVVWTQDGWLRLAGGGNGPERFVEIAAASEIKQIQNSDFRDDFDGDKLDKEWNSLRILPDGWCSLDENKGYLRITAGESPQSLFEHHILAIRQKDACFKAETSLIFEPENYMQMAGLMLYLSDASYLYAYISHDEKLGKSLRVLCCANDEAEVQPVCVPVGGGEIGLRFSADNINGLFEYNGGDGWKALGGKQDLSSLSGGFTGNFIGIAVHDMETMYGCSADFNFFEYRGLD